MVPGRVAPSDSFCSSDNSSLTVSLEEPCNTNPCPVAMYVATTVGDCSAPCYSGTGALPTVNVTTQCFSYGMPVDMSVCTAALPGPAPNLSVNCNSGAKLSCSALMLSPRHESCAKPTLSLLQNHAESTFTMSENFRRARQTRYRADLGIAQGFVRWNC
jgi:hypothetical protein